MVAFIQLTVITALRVLSRNRLRAGLTMLGIVIGVGAVIAMVSIGQGARAAVQAQVASMGTNVIVVTPGSTVVSGVRGGQGGAVTLTVSDAADMKKRSPLLSDTGWARQLRIFSSVVFPEPEAPMTATNSPRSTVRLMPRRACTATSPTRYTLDICSQRIRGVMLSLPDGAGEKLMAETEGIAQTISAKLQSRLSRAPPGRATRMLDATVSAGTA